MNGQIVDNIFDIDTIKNLKQLKNSINVLYEYIMTHYNLFPEDVEQKKSFTKLFEMCVNLIMFQPKVKQSCKSIFPCMA